MEEMKNKEFRTNTTRSLMSLEPAVLLRDIGKRWALLLAVAAVLLCCASIVIDLAYTPQYTTNATVVVNARNATGTAYNKLTSTNQLAEVFGKLLNSSRMTEIILDEVDMKSFDGKITTKEIPDTNLITITVEDRNPRIAFLVMEAILDYHTTITYQVIGDIVTDVLVHPTVPEKPSNASDPMKWMLLASVLVIFGIVAVSVAVTFLSDTVLNRTEAEEKLDCWCLGEVRHERNYSSPQAYFKKQRNALLITNPAVSFQFIETFQKLRSRVEQHLGRDRVIMITSAMENEGKSTVAVNLAMAMAKRHGMGRVLLVDMDLYKPACHKLLEIREGGVNASDVIRGDVDLQSGVITEAYSGLHVLLQRKSEATPAALLTSKGTRAMLAEARNRYDCVILDMPPMSTVLDMDSIMEYVDAALLVVQQNRCTARLINRTIGDLTVTRTNGRETKNIHLLGCVLNNVYNSVLPTANYGYGYGYGYGNGGTRGSGKYGYGYGNSSGSSSGSGSGNHRGYAADDHADDNDQTIIETVPQNRGKG